MRFLFLLFLISTSLSAQSSNNLKLKNYNYLDSIDSNSKDYNTKTLYGNGIIADKEKNEIGTSIFSIKITKDKNEKLVRLRVLDSNYYYQSDKQSQKEETLETIIYFDESQKPDLAKFVKKIYLADSLITTRTKLLNLKEENEDTYELRKVENFLKMIKFKN